MTQGDFLYQNPEDNKYVKKKNTVELFHIVECNFAANIYNLCEPPFSCFQYLC